jgi:hypothetical protein
MENISFYSFLIKNADNFVDCIHKTTESLNSHGQQFNQYQQNKRKFKQPWSTIQPISTKQQKV